MINDVKDRHGNVPRNLFAEVDVALPDAVHALGDEATVGAVAEHISEKIGAPLEFCLKRVEIWSRR